MIPCNKPIHSWHWGKVYLHQKIALVLKLINTRSYLSGIFLRRSITNIQCDWWAVSMCVDSVGVYSNLNTTWFLKFKSDVPERFLSKEKRLWLVWFIWEIYNPSYKNKHEPTRWKSLLSCFLFLAFFICSPVLFLFPFWAFHYVHHFSFRHSMSLINSCLFKMTLCSYHMMRSNSSACFSKLDVTLKEHFCRMASLIPGRSNIDALRW